MNFIKQFSEISKNDVDIAGGKGASLGEMVQAGIPVPQGFVILSTAFGKFLQETDLNIEIDAILETVNVLEMHTIEIASEKIHALVVNAKIPEDIVREIKVFFLNLDTEYVAVRSSATAEDSASAAWAGQLDSFLNTTEEMLLINVQRCWASLFTPRAIFYRFEKGLHEQKISVAVVVQKMVESECSGIAFSVHPVTQDRNQLIIEAGFGLGEAIVSGSVTPNSYVVKKSSGEIIDINVSTQLKALSRATDGGNEWKHIQEPKASSQVLNGQQILELSDLIIQIENHYGFPCDIEWAYEAGKFYITQSRPITTLVKGGFVRRYQKFFTREIPLIVMEYWHKGEYVEFKKIINNRTHFNPLFIKQKEGVIDVYYDMNNEDTALFPLFDFFKEDLSRFDYFVNDFIKKQNEIRIIIDNFKLDKFSILFNLMTEAWGYLPIWVQLGSVENELFPKWIIGKSLELRDNFQALEYKVGDVLLKAIEAKYPELKQYSNVISYKEIVEDNIPDQTELENRVDSLIYFEGKISHESLEEFTKQHKVELIENLVTIGEFADDIIKNKQIFIKAYTRNFSIIMQQAWFAANKENLIQKLDLQEFPYDPPYLYFMKDGVEEVWENKNANRWLLEKLVEKIKTDNLFFGEVYERYARTLIEAKDWYGKNITTHQELNDFINLIYKGVNDFVILYGALMDKTIPEKYQEMANSFRVNDSFFADCNVTLNQALETLYPDLGHLSVYITREEIGKVVSRDILEERDRGFVLIPGIFVGTMGFDNLIRSFPQYKFEIESGEQDEDGLKGRSAFNGLVKGIVRIVMRKDQIDQVAEGEIIVSPMTTPDMLPAMKKASAFVTDEGGITCHAAIIAREMKKPCIIGTKIATQVFKDGDLVEVDANNGKVRILNKAKLEMYKKIFSREYSLPIIQAWSRGESTDDRQYVPGIQPNLPYIIFENIDGLVSCYMNESGIENIRDVLKKELYKNNNFPKHVDSTFREKVKHAHHIWENNVAVGREDLVVLLSEIRDAWPWFEAFWWLADVVTNKDDIQLLNDLRLWGEGIGIKSNAVIEKSLKKLYPEYDDLNYFFSYDEIINNIIPTKEELMQRSKHYIFTNNTLFLDKSLLDIEKMFSVSIEQHECSLLKNEIKGSVGYQGNVQGKVRIILTKKNIHLLKQGEILVSSETTPDFMPAIQKALAIVTDEGGIMCHAAIVARELKKPCIIGTKVATKILNDGDLVELDTNNGVVRILKREN